MYIDFPIRKWFIEWSAELKCCLNIIKKKKKMDGRLFKKNIVNILIKLKYYSNVVFLKTALLKQIFSIVHKKLCGHWISFFRTYI